jgi:hypothetical protein
MPVEGRTLTSGVLVKEGRKLSKRIEKIEKDIGGLEDV